MSKHETIDQPLLSLTPVQRTVVALVSKGLSNKAIAERLRITEATVKAHVMNSNKRLGLSNRVQLAVWFIKATAADDAAPPVS